GPADSHTPWVPCPLRRSAAESARRRFEPPYPESRECRVASPQCRQASESAPAAPVGDGTSLSATPPLRRPATAPDLPLRCPRTSRRPHPVPHRSAWRAHKRERGCPPDTPCRTAGRSDRPVPAWPWCTAPLGPAGAWVELPASRQSPAPWLVESPPEPGRLPSQLVMLSSRSNRYYAPLQRPPLPPRACGVEGRDPSQRWVSRVAP